MPVVVQLDNASLSNPDTLQTLQIASPDNSTVFPLTQFVKLNMVSKPTAISSMNGLPSVTISANLAKGHQLSDAIPYINTLKATKAPTLNIAYRDNALQYIEGNTQTLIITGLGLFFIYLMLAILFNNIIDPFIILLTVPFFFSQRHTQFIYPRRHIKSLQHPGFNHVNWFDHQTRGVDCAICQSRTRQRAICDGRCTQCHPKSISSHYHDHT